MDFIILTYDQMERRQKRVRQAALKKIVDKHQEDSFQQCMQNISQAKKENKKTTTCYNITDKVQNRLNNNGFSIISSHVNDPHDIYGTIINWPNI